MKIKLPTSDTPVRTTPLGPGLELDRIHHSKFDGLSYNPGAGAPTRFAPLLLPTGTPVPTLYAADSYECAVFESIYHDVPVGAGTRIGFHRVRDVVHSRVRLVKPIWIAELNEPDLKRMGTTRSLILDSSPSKYSETARWALELREHHTHIQGLRWTSSKDNSGTALILFGDRMPSDALELIDSTRVSTCSERLAGARNAGFRIGCKIVW